MLRHIAKPANVKSRAAQKFRTPSVLLRCRIHERLEEEEGNTMMDKKKNGKKKEEFGKRNEDMNKNK
jgi:hypothetical protein